MAKPKKKQTFYDEDELYDRPYELGTTPIVHEDALSIEYVETVRLVHLRDHPDTSSISMALLPESTVLIKLEEINASWTKVLYEGREGFVMSVFLKPSQGLERQNGRP
jgi:hypothetical protein